MDGTVPQASNVELPSPRALICPAPPKNTEAHGQTSAALVMSAQASIRKLARTVGRGRPITRIDDLYQTGMEYAARLAPEYRPEQGTTFPSFVYLRVRRAMRQSLAREDREAAYGTVDHDDERDDSDRAAPSPEELVIKEEERRGTELAVGRALSRLDEVDRSLARAVLADGKSVAEAARAVGLGYDQARYRVGVAKEALRRWLGAGGGGSSCPKRAAN